MAPVEKGGFHILLTEAAQSVGTAMGIVLKSIVLIYF